LGKVESIAALSGFGGNVWIKLHGEAPR